MCENIKFSKSPLCDVIKGSNSSRIPGSWPHPKPSVGPAFWDHLVFVCFKTCGTYNEVVVGNLNSAEAVNRGLTIGIVVSFMSRPGQNDAWWRTQCFMFWVSWMFSSFSRVVSKTTGCGWTPVRTNLHTLSLVSPPEPDLTLSSL